MRGPKPKRKLVSVRIYTLNAPIDDLDVRGLKDNLRYDGAFVMTQSSDAKKVIAFPAWRTRDGRSSGVPTFGRWKSWGFELTPVERSQDIGLYESFERGCRPGHAGWNTYRYPIVEGRPDYSAELEIVALDVYASEVA